MQFKFKRRPLGLLFSIFIILIIGCNGCPPEQKNEPIKAPVAISFIKAKSPFDQKVKDVVVTLIDPKGKVVTASGQPFETMQLGFGVMSIGLKNGAILNDSIPYEFSLKANAPGYVENVQTIVIRKDGPTYLQVYMADMADPPQGLAVGTGKLIAIGGLITAPQTLSATFANGLQANLHIPKGTQLLANGKAIEGEQQEVQFSFAVGDPTNPAANMVFPNGTMVTNAVDTDGNVIATPGNPFYFKSAGWATIEMKVGDTEVDGFSNPLKLEIPVNTTPPVIDINASGDSSVVLYNTTVTSDFQEGQSVPVWSLDDATGQWREESTTTLASNGGNLMGSFDITHLSTWNLDLKVDACNTNDLVISYINTGCAKTLYSALEISGVEVTTPLTGAGDTQSHLLTYQTGGGTITIANYPDDANLEFVVSEAGRPDVSLSVGNCSTPATGIDVSAFPDPPTCEYLNLDFRIGASSTPTDGICNTALWYKSINTGTYDTSTDDANTNGWTYAGMLEKKVIEGADYGRLRTAKFNLDGMDDAFRLLILWNDSDASTTNDQSVRFTLKNDKYINSTNCGAVLTPAFNPNGNIPGSAIAIAPAITVTKKCYRASGSANQSCATSPGYNCDEQVISGSGGNGSGERGLIIEILNVTTGFVITPCPSI